MWHHGVGVLEGEGRAAVVFVGGWVGAAARRFCGGGRMLHLRRMSRRAMVDMGTECACATSKILGTLPV